MVLIGLLLLSCYGQLSAGSPEFHYIGPSGGNVTQIVPVRHQSKIWYAVNNGDLYRSTDTGRAWTLRLKGVKQVLVHPVTHEVLANLGNAMRVSKDQGRSFQPGVPIVGTSDATLVWHTTQNNILAAVSSEFEGAAPLLLSTDSGATWTAASGLPYAPGSTAPDALKLTVAWRVGMDAFLPGPDAREIYLSLRLMVTSGFEASPGPGVLLYSNDFGKSWQTLKVSKRSNDYSFHWDPAYPDRAFTFNRNGCNAISNGQLSPVFETIGLLQLKTVPGFANHLFAVKEIQNGHGDHQIVTSVDFGRTWKPYKEWLEHYVSAFQMTEDRERGILAASTSGIFYSNDTRKDWENRSKNLASGSVFQVSSSADGRIVYCARGRYKDFLIRSTDAGKTWTDIPFPNHQEIHEIAVNPKDSQHLVLTRDVSRGEWGQLTISRDGGKTWSYNPTEGVFGPFHPTSPNMLYFAGLRQLYVSNDYGASLDPLQGKLDLCAIFPRIHVDSFDPNLLFTVDPYYGSLFKSSDGGKTLTRIKEGLPSPSRCGSSVEDIASLSQPGSYLLVASGGGVYRSDDAGTTWHRISTVGGGDTFDEDHLYPADNTGDRFLAVRNFHLYESLDHGNHWHDITQKTFGIKGIKVLELSDPRTRPYYAATDRGVFRNSK